MTLAGFLAYCAALAIAAVIPGPQIVAIIAQGMRHGVKRATWMAAGMVSGDLVYLSAVLAGLSFIAETFSMLIIVIKWAGVAYLCVLALQYWLEEPVLATAPDARTDAGRGLFLSGALISIGNPKSVLFYISILPTVIDLRTVSAADAVTLLAITAAILSVAQFPCAMAGARARRALQSRRALRLFNRSAAVCMGGAAAAIALRD